MTLTPVTQGEPLFHAFAGVLATAGLPVDDLLLEPSRYYALNARDGGADAFGGVLLLREEALLRSVVVPAASQGRGFGAAIVERLASLAAGDGAQRIWLLTTDADRFFARLGWEKAAREAAPASIASTRQFASVCPASAVLMRRSLTG